MRASSRNVGEGVLYYQVMHRRMVRLIHSGLSLHVSEWDADREEVVMPVAADSCRGAYLLEASEILAAGLDKLRKVVERLESRGKGRYSATDVANEYGGRQGRRGLIAFGRYLVGQLQAMGKTAMAERYHYVLNRFVQFSGGKEVTWGKVTDGLMMAFENHLREQRLCSNTTSYYLRNLRAIYQRAVAKGLTKDAHPFEHVYTGVAKTRKRAISADAISRIRQLDFRHAPQLDYARDLFLFSLFMRGMSFVDMAYLRKTDLRGGVVSYVRQKTGRQLTIKWEDMMQEIVDKYDTSGSPYLLPIIRNVEADARRQYKSALRLMNNSLKTIQEMAGLSAPLTSYVARHTWATLAKERHISLSVISEAMGHDSEKTTKIYLASLDTSEVDIANRSILDALRINAHPQDKGTNETRHT